MTLHLAIAACVSGLGPVKIDQRSPRPAQYFPLYLAYLVTRLKLVSVVTHYKRTRRNGDTWPVYYICGFGSMARRDQGAERRSSGNTERKGDRNSFVLTASPEV